MKNILKYKGYTGSVEFEAEDRIFHGRILGIGDVIGFEGASVGDLEKDFHDAVDEYFETCRQMDKEPERPFSGQLTLRIPSQLHCAIAVAAKRRRKSINAWVAEVCKEHVEL